MSLLKAQKRPSALANNVLQYDESAVLSNTVPLSFSIDATTVPDPYPTAKVGNFPPVRGSYGACGSIVAATAATAATTSAGVVLLDGDAVF